MMQSIFGSAFPHGHVSSSVSQNSNAINLPLPAGPAINSSPQVAAVPQPPHMQPAPFIQFMHANGGPMAMFPWVQMQAGQNQNAPFQQRVYTRRL